MSNKKQTAVEWLFNDYVHKGVITIEAIEQAKEMENKLSHEYAEFAIRCDRQGMKILNFKDWIKL